MMHLRFTFGMGAKGHPKTVLKELGITYIHVTQKSSYDQWWFGGCENVPSELPEFLVPLNFDPMDYIGYGLSRDIAEQICKGEK